MHGYACSYREPCLRCILHLWQSFRRKFLYKFTLAPVKLSPLQTGFVFFWQIVGCARKGNSDPNFHFQCIQMYIKWWAWDIVIIRAGFPKIVVFQTAPTTNVGLEGATEAIKHAKLLSFWLSCKNSSLLGVKQQSSAWKNIFWESLQKWVFYLSSF